MKKQISLYLILLSFLLCSCGQASVGGTSGRRSGPDDGPTWEEQYDLGLRYLSDGNYEEAIIAFTAAIEIDPKRAPAYVGRGDAYSGTAQKLTGQAEDGELPDEAVSSYGSAVADYLAALDLDESTAEVYRKAAEVYVTLGDLDSAVALLERGISATGDEDLQTYLDELTSNGPLIVLTYQAAYQADGTMISFEHYFYNEQGYLIRTEYTHCSDGHVNVETWDYEGDSGLCWHTPDRKQYSTDEEWEADKQEEYMEPGTSNYWTSSYGGEYAVCVDPLVDADKIKEVLANNSTLINDEQSDYHGWDYAVYTFNDMGNPSTVTTYSEGKISGTAVLEWEIINPVS